MADKGIDMYFLRPSWAEINLSNLVHNLRQIKKIIKDKVKVLAVVKADGYGHGAVEISKIALKNGASLLGVALIEEGIELREAGIKAPILVMGSIYPFDNYKQMMKFNLTPVISSLSSLEQLSCIACREGRKIGFHLKIDTGMGRIGISIFSIPKLLEKISLLPGINFEGVYSHLSCADTDEEFTRKQINDFAGVIKDIKYKGNILKHIANSAAILQFPESHFDLVRPGLILYGLLPFENALNKMNLKPVMSIKTRIIFLKKVPKGTPISYGKIYVTNRTTRIATLPIGYADGYSHLLSNKAQVLIRGKHMPIIGKICMDMCMVDVTNLSRVSVGDEVVLMGSQGREIITAEEIASRIGTINYEVVCAISKRMPRVYTGI